MVLGNEDLKHPFFGTGVRAMAACQASRFCGDGGCAAVGGGAGGGAGIVEAGTPGSAEAAKGDMSPAKRLATIVTPRTVVMYPRVELQDLIGFSLDISTVDVRNSGFWWRRRRESD